MTKIFKLGDKTASIGLYRDDGDFAILATLNNNDDHFPDMVFYDFVRMVKQQIALRMYQSGNSYDAERLIALNREDTPDYVDTGDD